MSEKKYRIVEKTPTVDEYLSLNDAVGWLKPEKGAIQKALSNSLFFVCALHEDEVIGCARVIGDGSICFYVQDVVVRPEHQGKGVGKRIMDSVMDYIYSNAAEGAFVGLMAAPNVPGFYERYGFSKRPEDRPGMHMKVKKQSR